jgi:hypothetical protein
VVDIFGNDIMIIVEVPYRESGVDASFKSIESKGFGNGNHGEFAIIGSSVYFIEFDVISEPDQVLESIRWKRWASFLFKGRMLPFLK